MVLRRSQRNPVPTLAETDSEGDYTEEDLSNSDDDFYDPKLSPIKVAGGSKKEARREEKY